MTVSLLVSTHWNLPRSFTKDSSKLCSGNALWSHWWRLCGLGGSDVTCRCCWGIWKWLEMAWYGTKNLLFHAPTSVISGVLVQESAEFLFPSFLGSIRWTMVCGLCCFAPTNYFGLEHQQSPAPFFYNTQSIQIVIGPWGYEWPFNLKGVPLFR